MAPRHPLPVRYLRDGRAPVPKKESTSRVMSANRGRATGPEVALRQALRRAGVSGFRVNQKGLPGRPDLAFTRARVAVFVHGCFWHRCPYCRLPLPKSHTAFWSAKFERNRARDIAKGAGLREAGWRVVVVWECQVRRDIGKVVARVERAISPRSGWQKSEVSRRRPEPLESSVHGSSSRWVLPIDHCCREPCGE